jgi:glutathione S-transferase
VWVARCKSQIFETLDLLERERQAIGTPYWLGERISHADIAVACLMRFTSEAHPGLLDRARFPALHALSEQCEALPAFREIAQPFKVTMKND